MHPALSTTVQDSAVARNHRAAVDPAQWPARASDTGMHPPLLTVSDLRPGLKPPWVLEARVLGKSPFQRGTGFHAKLADRTGAHIPAFFFREAAHVHGDAVRPGSWLRLSVQTCRTEVRSVAPRFSPTGLQLVVDAADTVSADVRGIEPDRLGQLPALDTPVFEVFGLVASVGPLGLSARGQQYRCVVLADETSGPKGVRWYPFEPSVKLPDTVPPGTVARVSGAIVKDLGGAALSGGAAALLTGPGQEGPGQPIHPRAARVAEIQAWARGQGLL